MIGSTPSSILIIIQACLSSNNKNKKVKRHRYAFPKPE